MHGRTFAKIVFSGCLSLFLAWDDPKDPGETAGDGDTDGAGDGAGDGDQTGDDNGDPQCEMLAMDDLLSADCSCVGPGEPCAQGCFTPNDTTNCASVCASIGETCVENGCDGGTYLPGVPGTCPVTPGEFGTPAPFDCEAQIPWIGGMPSPEQEATGAACCCTQS